MDADTTMRNPFRYRYAVVLRIPGWPDEVLERAHFRSTAEHMVEFYTGKHGGIGQAYAPNLLHIEPRS